MNEWIIADLQHSYGLNCAAIVPDTAYMVMEFCSGKEENPDTITIDQMRSLGDVLRPS